MPATVALGVFFAYCGSMAAAGRGAEAFTARVLAGNGEGPAQRILASPTVINPLRWGILIEKENGYVFGDFVWSPRSRLSLQPDPVPTNMGHRLVAVAARQDKHIADFLYWSRFPFATIQPVAAGTEVVIGDARYGSTPRDGPFSIRAVVANGN